MSSIEWAQHTDAEVIEAWQSAPRIFGPWAEWDKIYGGVGYAWSRHEVFPGPCWKSGGTVSVQRNTECPGYAVHWWDETEDRRKGDFQTSEEAMAYGDAWLIGAGHRVTPRQRPDGGSGGT